MNSNNKRVVIILGPTSSGKTSLAVKLAYKFNGEIVSADSRQVFRGMDIGTGKDLKDFSFIDSGAKKIDIPYHLIDVVSPKTEFDVVKWNKKARRAIDDILKRGKLPIVVGGTGMYIQSLVDNYDFSTIKPDKKKRKILEDKSIDDLLFNLKEIKPEILNELDENDKGNKRRLIRYIEILENDKNFLIKKSLQKTTSYNFLILGLTFSREIINERIYKRLITRLEKEGMIDEVRRLHEEGLSWKRLEGFGLEYRNVSFYLQKKFSYEEMVEKLFIAIRQFAKRQMTWFRRWEKQGRKIRWVEDVSEANNILNIFLK